jgi:hypothetical protein
MNHMNMSVPAQLRHPIWSSIGFSFAPCLSCLGLCR